MYKIFNTFLKIDLHFSLVYSIIALETYVLMFSFRPGHVTVTNWRMTGNWKVAGTRPWPHRRSSSYTMLQQPWFSSRLSSSEIVAQNLCDVSRDTHSFRPRHGYKCISRILGIYFLQRTIFYRRTYSVNSPSLSKCNLWCFLWPFWVSSVPPWCFYGQRSPCVWCKFSLWAFSSWIGSEKSPGNERIIAPLRTQIQLPALLIFAQRWWCCGP